MFKKLISLIVAVVMVMALIAVPTMAASFSESNKRTVVYNMQTGGDSNLTLTNNGGGAEIQIEDAWYSLSDNATRNWKGKAVAKDTNNAKWNQGAIKYLRNNSVAGYSGASSSSKDAEAPRYIHQKFKFVWYKTGEKNASVLRFGLIGNSEGTQIANSIEINGNTANDQVFRGINSDDASITPETNKRMMYNKGTVFNISGTAGITENIVDIIVSVNDDKSTRSGMVYLFVNGELCSYANSATEVTDNLFWGWSISMYDRHKNGYIEAWMDEELGLGHTEYFEANGYIPTFEDVLNDAGLSDPVDNENQMMKISGEKFRWFMPHGTHKVTINQGAKTEDPKNYINTDVVWENTKTTVTHAQTAADTWEKTADLLQGVYPQLDHGIGYSSYHPRYKYLRFSFDQKLSDGTQLAYRLNDYEMLTGLQFRDNGGKLVAVVGDTTVTTDANTSDNNRIDWIIEPIEDETNGHSAKVYVFVNEKFVAEGTVQGDNAVVRLYNIGLYTKGSNPSVVYDNWSMTLYNTNQTYDGLYEEITGKAPSTEPTFEWTEECAIDDDMGDTFMVYAEAVAKNYDGEAKIVFAVYDENGNFLDVDYCDFVSGEIFGDEAEVKAFNKVYGDKTAASASIFLWEAATLVPLIGAKTLPVE